MTLGEHLQTLGLRGGAQKRVLQTGKVKLRGVPTSDAGREVDPAEVRVEHNAPRIHPNRDLAVIYKDQHLLVVWKPSGLLSVAAPKRGRDPNMVTTLSKVFGACHPVHRLDEGTSGLMLVARSPTAQGLLKDLLAERKIDREYLALVRGHFPATPFSVETQLGRDEHSGLRASVEVGGKRAVTHLSLIETLPGASLVKARLESGRTHQIRIHLTEAGYPVLGDTLYGRKSDRSMRRLALHAAILRFKHPLTGELLSFDAPLADDLERHRRFLLRRAEERKGS